MVVVVGRVALKQPQDFLLPLQQAIRSQLVLAVLERHIQLRQLPAATLFSQA